MELNVSALANNESTPARCSASEWYHQNDDRLYFSQLPDADLLELILNRNQAPRKAEELAGRLLSQFGSISNIINAPDDHLSSVDGMTKPLIDKIMLFRATMLRTLREKIEKKPVLHQRDALASYCKALVRCSDREEFRIIFLDKAGRLRADELHTQGTVDYSQIYIREVVKRALYWRASGMILLHIRPFNTIHLQNEGSQIMSNIADAVSCCGIRLVDYIIMSPTEAISVRDSSYLWSEETHIGNPVASKQWREGLS
jgi:DNA repair protein RadC